MMRFERGKKEMVTVAQSVELQIVVLAVAGSSPVGHPIFLSGPKGGLADLIGSSDKRPE